MSQEGKEAMSIEKLKVSDRREYYLNYISQNHRMRNWSLPARLRYADAAVDVESYVLSKYKLDPARWLLVMLVSGLAMLGIEGEPSSDGASSNEGD